MINKTFTTIFEVNGRTTSYIFDYNYYNDIIECFNNHIVDLWNDTSVYYNNIKLLESIRDTFANKTITYMHCKGFNSTINYILSDIENIADWL